MITDKTLSLEPYFAVEAPPSVGINTANSILESLNDSRTDDENTAKDSDDTKDDKSSDELDLKFLSDDDKEPEEDDTEEESEEKEEEESDDEDEDKEPELKLEEKEDELELSNIPKMRDIKAAYPDILKKFPALKHIFYREQAFAEVFPTVQDAKEAKESVQQFNTFQSELLAGNVENVFKQVKSTDPKAFDKIATGLLDSLVRVDPNAHLHITAQVTKGVLNYINKAAKQNLQRNPEDKYAQQLEIASELIHEAIYNTKEVSDFKAVKSEIEENPEEIKLKTERENFEKTRYTTAFSSVSSKINNLLTGAVTKEIDPRGILPPYVKKNVISDVMRECDRQLIGDKRFKSLVDALWVNAKKNGYSDESLNKIQTAIKEKAKTILPGIMKAKKGEAMKGLNSQPRKNDEKRELSRNNNTEENRTPREKLTNTRRDDDRNKPRPGESNRDFLMRD